MTKKDYWQAHVSRNPSFADESKEIRITVGMLRKLMEEAYDKGAHQGQKTSDALADLFGKFGVAAGGKR